MHAQMVRVGTAQAQRNATRFLGRESNRKSKEGAETDGFGRGGGGVSAVVGEFNPE